MQQLLFIQLLKEKSTEGFKQIYDAYACKLFSFILHITNDEEKAQHLLSETFFKIWNESPVIKLHHTTPFLILLQKASVTILENSNHSNEMKSKIINYTKQLRAQDSMLKVIVPNHYQNTVFSAEIMPRPTA